MVGNAFTAFVAVMVLEITQHFSTSRWLWELVSQAVHPVLQAVGARLPAWTNGLASYYNWFNANQLKFTFWLFYAAAICDDLGLPNYKTLIRWLWHRRRQPSPQNRPDEALNHPSLPEK